jgi:hypothetical protein
MRGNVRRGVGGGNAAGARSAFRSRRRQFEPEDAAAARREFRADRAALRLDEVLHGGYEATGQPAKAAEWRRRAAGGK